MTGRTWELPVAADDRPTYFSHALALAALHGPGPWPGGGYPLPDASGVKASPFLLGSVSDGIGTHHHSYKADASAATQIADLIQAILLRPPSHVDLDRLHENLRGQSPLAIADMLPEDIGGRDLSSDRLRALGRWLAEQGTCRGAVAVGLMLVGLAGDDRDRDLLLLLGALEDLTLYAVVALTRSQTDARQAVYALARRVEGWGRIHAVRRLAATQDPQIKAWLLRDGFRNGIMDEYLAHFAATTGDLHDALLSPVIDSALLDGAGGILDALCAIGGPAKDIRHYPNGPAVLTRYIELIRQCPPNLHRVTVVMRLTRFLATTDAVELEWTMATRSALQHRCQMYTADPAARAVVEQALHSGDLKAFRIALWPAARLDIPTRRQVRDRLHDHPYDAYLWQSLIQDCPANEVADTLALAEQLLPMADLANGPSTDLGFGQSHAPDQVLDLIVSNLDSRPGHGWALIKTALCNRTIRNRNMAIRTLDQWPPQAVPPDAAHKIQEALTIEPDAKLRAAMQKLLERLRTPADGAAVPTAIQVTDG